MLAITDILFMALAFVNVYFLALFFIVFALERKNIRKLPKIGKLPFVSVIIPAYNKEKIISETVAAVKGLDYPKELIEIMAIDDGSSDGTYGILKRIEGINAFRKPNTGKADTVNYGARLAKGDVIMCVDADSFPQKDSLIRAVQLFDDGNTAGVTVSVLAKSANNLIQKLQRIEYALLVLSRKLMESLNSIYVTPGPMALYRKDVFMKIGGLDRKNITEDIEIAWRLLANGYKIRMSIDSKVYTDVPDTLRGWWRQRIRWNVGGTQTAIKYFNFLFRRPSNIGMFILPLFMMSYVLTVVNIALIATLLSSFFYNFIFVYLGSVLMGANPLMLSFSFNPDILTVAGISAFAASLIWLIFSFNALKGEISVRKNLLIFALYMLFYISIHPFNLMASTWKLLRKNYKW